jgi:UDP-N-acetylmuramoyl-L-alanyl-D-glutamate--2,6-diaminopimelate ligase
VVGTTGHLVDGVPLDGAVLGLPPSVHPHTTPEAPYLQAILAHMADAGCGAVIMEVSSVGLAAHRVDAIPFRVAAFTNLSRDHLDVHGTMEAYRAAKARLFHELLPQGGTALLHAGDPASASMRPAGRPTWTYGLEDGDLCVEDPRWSPEGTEAQVRTPAGSGRLHVPLPGRHNVENALAALGIALLLGVPLGRALEGIAAAPPVPGRLEPVPNRRGFAVFVDYAHTPDALERSIAALRNLTAARLIVVFGCGGDRDRKKRPLMGQVAARGADVVVVTSDNPRTEVPQTIVDQIVAGVEREPLDRMALTALGNVGKGYAVEIDRRTAITAAIRAARSGDIVLIAGKGHEDYQILGKEKIHFDDREEAGRVLSGLASFVDDGPIIETGPTAVPVPVAPETPGSGKAR